MEMLPQIIKNKPLLYKKCRINLYLILPSQPQDMRS